VLRLLDEALAALPRAPTALRAQVLARLAVAGSSNRDPRLMSAYAEEALATARLVGDRSALVSALHACLVTAPDPAHVDGHHALAREMLDASEGNPSARVLALCALARLSARRCDIDSASRCATEAATLAGDTAPDIVLATMWFPLFRATLDGDLKAALAAADTTGDVARRALTDPDAASSMVNAIKMVARTLLDTDQEHASTRPLGLDEIVWPQPNLGYIARAGAAMFLVRTGQPDAARAVLAPITPAGLSMLERDMYWPGVVWTVSTVAHLLGDATRAAALYPGVLPFAGQLLVDPAGACLGCTDHYLGLLAHTCHRVVDAERHLAAATRIYEHVGARWWSERVDEQG
jgi:hypothetical protein